MTFNGSACRVSTRVRYWLWKNGVPKSEWHGWLNTRLEGPETRLLNGDLLSGRLRDDLIDENYLQRLADLLGLSVEDLRFGEVTQSRDQLLVENLNHLIKGEGFGGKGRLARELGVNPTTISRWLSGESLPAAPMQGRLVTHFRLPKGTSLARDPVFLDFAPVSFQEKKAWVESRLATLTPETLGDLFPALQRLLERP